MKYRFQKELAIEWLSCFEVIVTTLTIFTFARRMQP